LSRQVVWEAEAIDQVAGFLRDDPDGVREVLDAVGRLAEGAGTIDACIGSRTLSKAFAR
jgi:hypothetical protein